MRSSTATPRGYGRNRTAKKALGHSPIAGEVSSEIDEPRLDSPTPECNRHASKTRVVIALTTTAARRDGRRQQGSVANERSREPRVSPRVHSCNNGAQSSAATCRPFGARDMKLVGMDGGVVATTDETPQPAVRLPHLRGL